MTAFLPLGPMGAVQSARASEPPSGLCSRLPAADFGKVLGKKFGPPARSVAPRPYRDTAEGTDWHNQGQGNHLNFRAWVDPSPAAATELFARLSAWYGPNTPVAGMGDQAHFDRKHALHRKRSRRS
ncbi:MAG TPA: hypothetical protein VMB03_23930 [Bryobacteraceae bacterium]|nr:hypothetical protein [Bryobacteraceae bacterium]